MKKHLLIATGLAVLSTSAFATKARLEALGNGATYLTSDTRNVFRNAAHVNSMKNYVVTEWGTAVNTSVDTVAAPDAEGGFYRESGNFAYGLYLGSQRNDNNAARAASDATYVSHDNSLDLFIAGDAGVEWGARVHYAGSKNEPTATSEVKQDAMGVGLGIVMGDLEVWTNLDLSDNSEGASNTNDKWEAELGLNVGLSYAFGNMTAWADYASTGFEVTTAGTKTEDNSTTSITVGLGKVHEAGAGARVFYNAQFNTTTNESGIGTTTEVKTTSLPVTIGFEADATKWLSLRGSVSQNVFLGNAETTTGSTSTSTYVANSTNVQAGATLNFGKLKVDGMIGLEDATGAGSGSELGQLRLDNLMSRVAVHYWF